MTFAVQGSADLERVLRLPRRRWTPEQTAHLVQTLTAALRTPRGTATLFPLQAISLAEIAQWGGLLAPIPVGGGKTLTSLLAPRMLPHVRRPLLTLPAHLIEKTEREEREYRKQWVLPPFVRKESYQTLSRVGAADFLDTYRPDLIILDEAHYAKNPRAAVTRRIGRYLRERRGEVALVVLTGTIFGRSLRDFAHLAAWALPRTNPLPDDWMALDEWCRALDVDVPAHRRLAPGELARFRSDPLEEVRVAYGRRLYETPGVVMSQDPPLPIPLRIRSHIAPLCAAQEDAIARLRRTWETPDGELAEDGVAVWRHARELATGFYSVWVPRPPDAWRDARREWARTCRDILAHNQRDIDTELQLIQNLQYYPDAGEVWADWQRIAPTFAPNPVPHWISDETLGWIVKWARERPGLIWTDRPAVGERLRELAGLPYYGEDGVDVRTGRYVESHDPRSGSAVLSRRANESGRNLQAWSRSLVVDVPASGSSWEQLIGRTHRQGQKAPVVEVDVLLGVREDVEAFWRARGRATGAQEITGQPQKLMYADLEGFLDLDTVATWSEPRWRKTT